jgi:hypothetical protein
VFLELAKCMSSACFASVKTRGVPYCALLRAHIINVLFVPYFIGTLSDARTTRNRRLERSDEPQDVAEAADSRRRHPE